MPLVSTDTGFLGPKEGRIEQKREKPKNPKIIFRNSNKKPNWNVSKFSIFRSLQIKRQCVWQVAVSAHVDMYVWVVQCPEDHHNYHIIYIFIYCNISHSDHVLHLCHHIVSPTLSSELFRGCVNLWRWSFRSKTLLCQLHIRYFYELRFTKAGFWVTVNSKFLGKKVKPLKVFNNTNL